MRYTAFPVVAMVLVVSAAGHTQEVRVTPSPGVMIATSIGGSVSGKLGLGVASGSERDTLGLLVTSIVSEGPAEKAGIIEGDRLVAVNDVPLTLSKADAGEPDMAMILRRRLERELEKVDANEEVTLRVWSAGRTREVKVRAGEDVRRGSTANVYGSYMLRERSNRPVIGVSLAATGSSRDTLGVFVTSVAPGGPAERAGIIEGHRIAAINGIDLRVPAADAGDAMIASTRSSRLAREIEKLEPGARVQLRVWADGRYRDVTVEVAPYGDVYKNQRGSVHIGGSVGAALAAPRVLLRSVPDMVPARPEPLDSLWRRREELRRSVDPRADSLNRVFDFRFNDRIRDQIEQSLNRLRELQMAPSRSTIITTSISM